MCTTYKAFGAVGLITSGAGRDLEQVAALDFPCFTGGTICAHGYCHIPSINVPIHVGGVTVQPGDLLHGDCNGVSTIPHEIASEVAHACAEYVAAEAVVLDYLRAGGVDPKGFSQARAECKERIDALARRLKAGINHG
jgi:regulator of RNase E activity RraA